MQKERGFTLVETLVAVALTGLVFIVLGTAMRQVVTIPESGNNRLTALHELQNTAQWVNLDAQAAKATTGGGSLVLTLTDNSTVSYDLAGTTLTRTAGGAAMSVARNITALDFSVAGRAITMEITASPDGGSTSENGTYEIYLRPSEE